MPYMPVTRTITIQIHRPRPVGPYTIEVVAEYAVAVIGDTVTWNIQGAPRGIAVSVGNFQPVNGEPLVMVHGGAVRVLAQNFPVNKIRRTRDGLSCKMRGVQPGIYKYDILFNGETVRDPEIEIKRPL